MKKVVIVGVGALGSHLIQFLRNEAELAVIDFDRVEQKNTLSQFHGRPGSAKNKTQSIAQTMQFLWGTKLKTTPHKMTADNVAQLCGGADLVIDCLDNIESRVLLQEHCRKASVQLLHGALAADGAYGQVIWDESFKADGGGEGAATCEDGEHLPFIAIVSGFLARAAQEYLNDGKKAGYTISPVSAQRV
jgi:molybdopterin/thiamine biosynthesis adenylyltransferase